jgi:hypothetical protein
LKRRGTEEAEVFRDDVCLLAASGSMQDFLITRSSDYQIIRSPDHPITGSPDLYLFLCYLCSCVFQGFASVPSFAVTSKDHAFHPPRHRC